MSAPAILAGERNLRPDDWFPSARAGESGKVEARERDLGIVPLAMIACSPSTAGPRGAFPRQGNTKPSKTRTPGASRRRTEGSPRGPRYSSPIF